MKAIEEISNAIGHAKHMILNGEIGEDRYGEVWIKRPGEDWTRLNWLLHQEQDTEGEHVFAWLDIALTALYEAQEVVESIRTVDTSIGQLHLVALI